MTHQNATNPERCSRGVGRRKLTPDAASYSRTSQYLLELVLLILCQTRGELYLHTDDEISPLIRCFALRHTQAWEPICVGWLCWPTVSYVELFAIDRGDCSFPTGERFFEVDFNVLPEIVPIALV